MANARTPILLGAATVVSGLLAGGIVDRVIVGGPAWHVLGAESWLQYSRHADLGTGLVAYPIEGIGTTVLIVAATVSNYLDTGRRWMALPLYYATAFSIAGLFLTVKAAPIMLSLAEAQSAVATESAFEEFYTWGLYLRGAADTLAFAALVWALATGRSEAENVDPSSIVPDA